MYASARAVRNRNRAGFSIERVGMDLEANALGNRRAGRLGEKIRTAAPDGKRMSARS